MVALIGYGPHGKDILATWMRAHKGKILSIYDDDSTLNMVLPRKFKGSVLFGINDPHARFLAAFKHHLPGATPLIDPTAIIGDHVKIGLGSVVSANAVLLHDVRLGPHVHINYASTMTRCRIKGFSTIAPGVTICGDVEIGHRSFIGAGAVVCNRVTIGHDVVVGAGAVIPPNTVIPDGTTVVGVPARQLEVA